MKTQATQKMHPQFGRVVVYKTGLGCADCGYDAHEGPCMQHLLVPLVRCRVQRERLFAAPRRASRHYAAPERVVTKIITDREIQLAREHARDAGNASLVEMLQQLVEYRRVARKVLTEHDYRMSYNKEMSHLDTLVGRSGCQWWQCDQQATTRRMRAEAHSRGDAATLCCTHADEGEVKGLWDMDHPQSVEWKRSDMSMREWRRKRDEEIAQEGAAS